MVAAVTVRKDGFAEMAYVGQKPWHGLGQELNADADVDTWKKQAGMDWTVQRGVVRYATARGENLAMQDMPESHVLFRSDSKAPLGIVSSRYQVVQPGDVLEFFRDLTESNGYTLNTAGTLFDGKRFWALASIGDEAEVVKGDKVGGYMLLSSSCDGTLATAARFTTVRVVCNNTLTMAMAACPEVSIRHTTRFDNQSVKQELGLAHNHFEDTMKVFERLAQVEVSVATAEDLIATVLVDKRMSLGKDPKNSKPYQDIMGLFNGQALGASMVGNTAWALVNSVTEYVDHHARAKTDSHRMSSAWFGRGDELKNEVLRRAVKAAA